MQAIKDMFGSERAVFALALIIAASTLAALGHMTIDQWLEFSKWIATVYIGSKALTGAAEAWASGKAPKVTVSTLEVKGDDPDRFAAGLAAAAGKQGGVP